MSVACDPQQQLKPRAIAANWEICWCFRYTDDVRFVPGFDWADIAQVCEWLIAQCLRLPRVIPLHTCMKAICVEVACMHDNPCGNKICVIF